MAGRARAARARTRTLPYDPHELERRRRQRMHGKQVFQPIGFDTFGIHTENLALRTDRHPKELTSRTTETSAPS